MYEEVLITHNDLDGAGVRVVYELANWHRKDKVHIIHADNGEVDQKVKELLDSGNTDPETTTICFGDICASREVLIRLSEDYTIMIWDHHRTNSWAKEIVPSAEIISELVNGKLESGTSLIYNYYRNLSGKRPSGKENIYISSQQSHKYLRKFVETVQSYDTYAWKASNNMEAKNLQVLFSLLGMEKFVAKYVAKFMDLGDDAPLIEENDMRFISSKIDQEQSSIDRVKIEDVMVVDLRGYKCAVRFSNGGMNVSELSFQFLSRHPEIDIFIGVDVGNGGFAYRTIKDNIDTGAIFAKSLGGGGHPKASGSPIAKDTMEKIQALILGNLG